MEFLKERCYTALNADELKQGDKVIVAETLMGLRENVENNAPVRTIKEILGEDFAERFNVDIDWNSHLAYLVERKENCTNCGAIYTCAFQVREHPELDKCKNWKPKTEQKAEKHYRPFKDTDELIKVFCEKTPKIYDKDDEKLFMPYIWVRNKSDSKVWLITEFDKRILDYLFTNCEFLDGSPCGVEE